MQNEIAHELSAKQPTVADIQLTEAQHTIFKCMTGHTIVPLIRFGEVGSVSYTNVCKEVEVVVKYVPGEKDRDEDIQLIALLAATKAVVGGKIGVRKDMVIGDSTLEEWINTVIEGAIDLLDVDKSIVFDYDTVTLRMLDLEWPVNVDKMLKYPLGYAMSLMRVIRLTLEDEDERFARGRGNRRRG